jgi:putative selenate reductase FAD-binding subunit
MIEQFLRPASIDEAIRLKSQYKDEAVFMAGGSKVNATPTRTRKKVAISLNGLHLNEISSQAGQLLIGATATLQQLIDDPQVPAVLREAAGFIYSRNVRNQATLGGEICAQQDEAPLVPVLLAMEARVMLADGDVSDLESYLGGAREKLVLTVVLPDPSRTCATRRISRSAAGLAVLTAAVAMSGKGQCIAIDGVVPRPVRLRDVEKRNLTDVALELAVSEAVAPVEDVRGSVAYKRYIAGVVVADLLADCLQMKKES